MKRREDTAQQRREQYQSRYLHFKHLGRPFWPDIILEDAGAAVVVFLGLLLMTVLWAVPLEPRADPTNSAYIPRPEWYFMFLFQMLKVFPGYLEWVGVIAVPSVGVLLLVLLPFYDRHPRRLPGARPIAMASGAVALVAMAAMTVLAFISTPPPAQEIGGQRLTAAQMAGRQLFNSNCAACHSLGGRGGPSAIPLDGVTSRLDPAFVHQYIEDPQSINPSAAMPPFIRFPDVKKLSHEETEYIVQYLTVFNTEAQESK